MKQGSPKITVLMPVFNGERYLAKAVESILAQTCADFELLVIDDGSTDGSADLVRSYADPRISLVENGKNLGLVPTLNRGIDLARGKYIARMDGDDISLPHRLSKQAGFLDADPDSAAVAVMVEMMDREGKSCGEWGDDRRTGSRREIFRFLPRANCLAHPGMMIRTEVLAKYRYNPSQFACEDYDLWLRMCADGLAIDKIAETLLRYRVNPGSLTFVSRGRLPDLKNVRTKYVFLRQRMGEGKVNLFVFSVFLHMLRDLFYALAKGILPFKLMNKVPEH